MEFPKELEVKGYTGQLLITETKIVLKNKGVLSFIAKKNSGEKEIPIQNITAIEFKRAGMLTNGRIQFSIQGEIGHKGSGFSAINDENTILFTNGQQADFIKAKEMIEFYLNKSKQTSNSVSVADEIKKFSELRDNGVISEEEFQQKKKSLLGL